MTFPSGWGRRLCVLATVVLLAACGGGGDDSASNDADLANLETVQEEALPPAADQELLALNVKARAAAGAPTRLIVKFTDDVTDAPARGRSIAAAHGGRLHHVYEHGVKGFAVTLPAAAMDRFMQAMEQRPEVDLVEADEVVTADGTVQPDATWGLDRADQRALPLSGTYGYQVNGTGVRAYIIDTGLRSTHQEFTGRVLRGFTTVPDGLGTGDCNGHGTHVAGTVGGTTWGMAKGVSLVPVRVLDCYGSGYVSDIVAGIDWMVANAVLPAVANLSLGGGVSATLDAAVAKAVSAGITMAVAAGNSNVDACTASPAREPSALTVGATDSTDRRADYSNWGSCLDLFAPGSAITSASYSSDSGAAIMSGTSMAAPHVAGLAALYLQAHPAATPKTVAASIKSAASLGMVFDAGAGSPNALMYSLLEPAPAGEAPATTAVAVAALRGSGKLSTATGNWRALVTVTVKDASGAPVAGAVVTGDYTLGGTGLGCTTGSTGVCRITSGVIGRYRLKTTFTVRKIAGSGLAYNGAANTVSSVTIRRP